MGFHLDMPLGHGTAGPEFTAFDPSRAGSMTGAAPARLGVWTEVNPKPGGIAEEFAERAAQRNRGSPRVIPLVHRADRPASIALKGEETTRQIAATLAQAWDDGFDAVWIKNFTRSAGRHGSVLVVKDPAQLRHPDAVFDPTRKHSSNLFAGFGGAGLFAPLAFPLARTEQRPEQPAQ